MSPARWCNRCFFGFGPLSKVSWRNGHAYCARCIREEVAS